MINLTEKTFKKLMHYLGSNADYDNLSEVKNYIETREKNKGITLEQWEDIFEMLCYNVQIPLQKWILEEKIKLLEVEEDSIRYVMIVAGRVALKLELVKKLTENVALLCEYAPKERKREFLGTAFVFACGYNNIYMVKALLEMGVDVEFRFKGFTGLDMANKYAESMEGYGDDTIYQYLLNNQFKTSGFEDVQQYYVEKSDFFGTKYLEYESQAAIKKAQDMKILDSKICRYRTECLAKEYGYDNILDDDTSVHILADMMEEYNWDDGFELPYNIAMHKNCDLALALKIFYDGEGYLKFFDRKFYESEHEADLRAFIEPIYRRIVNGCYKSELHYRIPLSDSDKDKMMQLGAEEILWLDV